MVKKIITLGVIFIVLLPLLSCKNNYKYKENDFNLIISVDRTQAKLGDTIEVTAVLENLSGKDIPIQMNHPDDTELEDIISIGVFKEDEEHDFYMTSIYGPRKKMTIKKDAVINRTINVKVDELINYDITSLVIFFTGRNYKHTVAIYSEVKKINII